MNNVRMALLVAVVVALWPPAVVMGQAGDANEEQKAAEAVRLKKAKELESIVDGYVNDSVSAILNEMPKKLWPNADGKWDRFTFPKVSYWFKRKFTGKTLKVKLRLQRGTGQLRLIVKGKHKGKYIVFPSFEVNDTRVQFKKADIRFANGLKYEGGHGMKHISLALVLPESTAKKLDNLKGKPFILKAKVLSCELGGYAYKRGYWCEMSLKPGVVFTPADIAKAAEARAKAEQPRKPKTPAEQAASRLNIAKNYRKAGMEKPAEATLREIIKKWPDSEAAKEAAKLFGVSKGDAVPAASGSEAGSKPDNLGDFEEDDAVRAASRLSLARNYLKAGMKEKAKAILQKVVEQWPNSTQASEAKKLLAGVGNE